MAQLWLSDSRWNIDDLSWMELTLILLKFLKLLFIPVYLNCPHRMRLVIFADAFTRVFEAILPCNQDILAKELPILLSIDIFVSYCYQFYIQWILINVEIIAVYTVNSIVMYGDLLDTLKLCFLTLILMNIIYLCIALIRGRAAISRYQLHLAIFANLKFTHNLK